MPPHLIPGICFRVEVGKMSYEVALDLIPSGGLVNTTGCEVHFQTGSQCYALKVRSLH